MLRVFFILSVSICLFAQDAITPIPFMGSYDKEKAQLGKSLFFDKILSKDGTISCSSCHELPGNGANSTEHSFGINNKKSLVNSPTVLNSVFNLSQFFDGRAKDLKDQALISIVNPLEMDSSIEEVLVKLNNSSYKKRFQKIYKDGITTNNLAEVIAEFEKALITPNSRFDRYLRGDRKAINDQEKRGYKAFKELGCISCHNGVNIGGNMHQKMGIIIVYDHMDSTQKNLALNGRYNVTKRERDKLVFKVPTLRNIALTAPYLHDGSVETLKDVIIDMREHQLGLLDESSDVDDIEMFLKTLTGEMPEIIKKIPQAKYIYKSSKDTSEPPGS